MFNKSNFIYAPRVDNLGGIMQAIDPTNLAYLSPMIPSTALSPTVNMESEYGTSQAQGLEGFNGGVGDILNMLNFAQMLTGE